MTDYRNLEPKPLFQERMKKLLQDYDKWISVSYTEPVNSIRCNTLKITPEDLKSKLEKKGWKISQLSSHPETSKSKDFDSHRENLFPEIMIIENKLLPGEIGNSEEHLLGYYYVQEISSMMPVLALNPQPGEIILDLCAAPGSKTTQLAMYMENQGTIIANDSVLPRIKILSSNLQKNGVSNTIITRNDGVQLCLKLKELGMFFDKILLDAPCSGEGTIRSSPKTLLMWNLKGINKLSRLQKKLASSALSILKTGGEMIYSTCTHAPEENEEVVDYLIKNFNVKVEQIHLPIKCRQGLTRWENETYSPEIEKSCRIYPQDNNTEGFFLAKIRKLF